MNFSFSYDFMGVGPGYECMVFKVKNLSGVTWESYNFYLKDTTLNVVGGNSSNEFPNFDAWCTLSGGGGSIGPNATGTVAASIVLLTNPAGDHFDATLMMCTGNTQTGTCMTKTMSSTFGP
jgi:hypothetical protein